MKFFTTKVVCAIFIVFSVINLTGCSIHYVADYDASIKQEILQLAKNVDLFWGELIDTDKSKRQYSQFKSQYNQIESDIRILLMKNEIRALNKESTKQAKIALELWVEDRKIHKTSNTFSDFEANSHRKQYMKAFTAMAKGEEAKNLSSTGINASTKGE